MNTPPATPAPAVSSAPPPRPEAPPLTLVAPDWGVLDTLARRTEPALLWPVGSQSLVAHWLDHAVRLGCREVTLYCPDRPALVRSALEGGAYWSLKLDLRPSAPPPETQGVLMDRLPGMDALPSSPADGAGLVRWWLDLNLAWLAARDPAHVHLDVSHEPGGWIGPRAVLSPGVVLKPPYWIGSGCLVGPGCTIGPDALIGPGSVIGTDVHLRHALVQGGTFVGSHLDLHDKLLVGPLLLDPTKGARAEIIDDFIASAMRRSAQSVPSAERLLAALLWPLARLLALGAGPASSASVMLPGDARIDLATGGRGPLLARRARWLGAVVKGRIRLIGVLPRGKPPVGVPDETRALLSHTLPGVFSLADLHGAHSPDEPDEFAHSLYQAAIPAADREVREALFKLCLTRPAA